MRARDFRKLENEELIARLSKLKEDLFDIDVKLSLNQSPNFKQKYNLKRDIARIKTILTERKVKID